MFAHAWQQAGSSHLMWTSQPKFPLNAPRVQLPTRNQVPFLKSHESAPVWLLAGFTNPMLWALQLKHPSDALRTFTVTPKGSNPKHKHNGHESWTLTTTKTMNNEMLVMQLNWQYFAMVHGRSMAYIWNNQEVCVEWVWKNVQSIRVLSIQ